MISGLSYQPYALTAEQQRALLASVDSGEWVPLTDSPNSRRVQHYGFRYDYKRRTVSEPTVAIPPSWKAMFGTAEEKTREVEEAGSEEKKQEEEPIGVFWNQVIVNEYVAGQGISAHVDSPAYGERIACYTLGSGATMRFTHVETNERVEFYVEPGSVYVMTGDARYRWKHEMVARKSDVVGGKKVARGRRVSVTLRFVPPS